MNYQEIYNIKTSNYFGLLDIYLYILLIVFFILFIKFLMFTVKYHKNKNESKGVSSLLLSILFGIISLFIIGIKISWYMTHLDLVNLINNKEFQFVEGEVKNYNTMNITDKKEESFMVGNILFAYNPAKRTGAFCWIKGDGNPISEGDKVRIKYFKSPNWGDNLILQLEWKPKTLKAS